MSTTHEKTQKTMWRKIKIILTNFFFIIFNFILYYLLTLNIILYKRNKKYLIWFLLIFGGLLPNVKWYTL